MNRIGVFNETIKVYDQEIEKIKELLNFACQKEHLDHVEFNVILVENDKIHLLNKTYRGIDRVTDVITFALEDEDSVVLPNQNRVLGDIYLSMEKAIEQAKEYGHSFEREYSFLVVHGFYHLLGYDHQTKEEEKVMFQKQEEVLDSYGIKR